MALLKSNPLGFVLAYQIHSSATSNISPIGGTIERSISLLKARLLVPGDSRQSVDKLPLEMVAKAKLVALNTQSTELGVGMLI